MTEPCSFAYFCEVIDDGFDEVDFGMNSFVDLLDRLSAAAA
nr:hypothetical protein [uncultured Brevundimonas sp.]